jgi:hypothetical protein
MGLWVRLFHLDRMHNSSNSVTRYRNYLMMCSALLSQQTRPEYHSLIMNNSRRPGVRNLQRLIKEAWDAGTYSDTGMFSLTHKRNLGFDQEGQQQLKDLVGTSKWIGTAGPQSVFSYSI